MTLNLLSCKLKFNKSSEVIVDTVIILLVILVILAVINLIAFGKKKITIDIEPQMKQVEQAIIEFKTTLEIIDKSIREEFKSNREETANITKTNREELSASLKSFEDKFAENIKSLNDLLREKFNDFSEQQKTINNESRKNLNDIKETIEKQLTEIRTDNNKQLEEMRITVDEKLQKTLNARLSQSFETVGKQLQAVQEGLGEMKNLAQDVGSLKRVLSNVKLRGGIGEVQLEMLLEQILAPDQWEKNVATKKGSNAVVEFAIKLPGKDEDGTQVWLPIDAKFPKDVYEHLQDAYESADQERIEQEQKNLENTIKGMAKDISQKYIDPPNTTDFAIMFLPFEGIYAEVVRKAALLYTLQSEYKVIVTGPTTIAAILNSLQKGFKTLAIQKRSSEVWRVLSDVKKEFGKFGDMLQKAKKNIQTGLGQIETVMTTRTNVIERKLKNVETFKESGDDKLLDDNGDSHLIANSD
jgi:DNA recombination protein RmuC